MPYFKSNNISLYYESEGSGKPIIFIPPPALGAASFHQQKEQLTSSFRVITFDPPGNGNSYHGKIEKQSIEDWTEDILALANHLSLNQVILCGYSLGGLPAQEFASTYPSRTAGLILICSFPEVQTKFLSAKIKAGEFIAGKKWMRLLAKGLSISHSSRHDTQRLLEKEILRSSPLLVKSLYDAGRFHSVTRKLEYLKCPVAFIYGAWDPISRPYADLYKQKIRHVDLIKIPNAAHQLVTRASPQVNAIIRSLYQ